jgi:hypothetical protein
MNFSNLQYSLNPLTYWVGDDPRAKKLSDLYDTLVPQVGEADTMHGELIRIFNKHDYEIYNNGGGNMWDRVSEGYDRWYADLLDEAGFIFNEYGFTDNTIEELKDCIDSWPMGNEEFCDLNMRFGDEVWYIVTNTENRKRELNMNNFLDSHSSTTKNKNKEG